MTDRAHEANSSEKWDTLWAAEGLDSWRNGALAKVYERIVHLASATLPEGTKVVDVGGGGGALALLLRMAGFDVEVWEHNDAALSLCLNRGVPARRVDLLGESLPDVEPGTVFVSTECLEHLGDFARHRVMELAARSGGTAFFSVPNDRLGPDEEPQHAAKFTAVGFRDELRRHFEHARVECLGPPALLPKEQFPSDRGQPAYLLGVCGFRKGFKLSMTMPVRDEAADIERVLASFRGPCDEIVIGVDPRTKDDTWKICEKYADVVFELSDLRGPPDRPEEWVPEGGIHFSHARNQCVDRCTGDWIFMTEGHEHLGEGQDVLLLLDRVIPDSAKVGMVLRTSNGQQWGFPWLFRRDPRIRFKRATHNVLDYPDGTFVVYVKGVKTVHDRVHERDLARHNQRKVQNRLTLMQDWSVNKNANSLYYLGTEWREFSEQRAVQFLREYLALERSNGSMRYQTRLILAKQLATMETKDPKERARNLSEAREVLMGCAGDDWVRTDHWVWLGDLAFDQERYDEALQFYLYGASRVGDPPFTLWWIELSYYSYIPCQRLAMTYSALGRYHEALVWADRVVEQLPADSPPEMVEECKGNAAALREALGVPDPQGEQIQ